MTYDSARDHEQKGKLGAAIAQFVNRYQANTANPKLPRRKTVILFPGGMGSHLVRARKPYNASTTSYSYDTAWLDYSVVSGAVNDLKMQSDIDSFNRIVVADGPVDFAFVGLTPYAGFIDWCDTKGIDWFILGWDWRRKLERTVDLFLSWFLDELQRQVQLVDPTADPLTDFSVIGHSFGGMVAKLIANDYTNAHVIKMNSAVTVGSPFYGHGGHVHRYFEGDPDLPMYFKSDVVRAVSSMHGGYTLLYMDLSTYNSVAQDLANDPDFPLTDYPVTDATTGLYVDPYNPQETSKKFRYPQKYWFEYKSLGKGLTTYKKVAQALDDSVKDKFYNIRGVLGTSNGPSNSTTCNQTWKLIPKTYNPDLSFFSPAIVDTTHCPGDGVIPAWSARHLSVRDENVRTFVGPFKHMDLMSFDEIHLELEDIFKLPVVLPMVIGNPKQPPRRRRRPTLRIASDTAMQTFRDKFEAVTRKKLAPVEREREVRRILAEYSLPELSALMKRGYENALKSPGEKIGKPEQKRRKPPKGKKKPAKKRRK
ncbi:MAG: hypothetical protein ACXWKC_12630 [Xanthobacteraceae bacterium]